MLCNNERPSIFATFGSSVLGVAFLPAPFINFPVSQASTLDRDYPWPSVPPVANTDQASLEAIVLKGRTDEIAAERKAARGSIAQDDSIIWRLAAGGLLMMLILPIYFGPMMPNSRLEQFKTWRKRRGVRFAVGLVILVCAVWISHSINVIFGLSILLVGLAIIEWPIREQRSASP